MKITLNDYKLWVDVCVNYYQSAQAAKKKILSYCIPMQQNNQKEMSAFSPNYEEKLRKSFMLFNVVLINIY